MEKHYGILMNRKLMDNGVYIFKPEYLIEGILINDGTNNLFVDDLKNRFLSIEDVDTIYSDTEQAVSYIISEKELKEKYKDIPLSEAKINYYNGIRNLLHLGFYSPREEKIVIFSLNIDTFVDSINSIIEKHENEKAEQLITIKPFDPQEFYEKLINFYHKSYDVLNGLTEAKEYKKAISVTVRGFMTFCEYIETQDKELYNIEYVLDTIFSYIDEIETICASNDINEMKEEMLIVYNNYLKKIEKIKTAISPTKLFLIETNNSKEQQKRVEKQKELEIAFSESKEPSLKIRDIKAFFDKKIIGQEEAKKDIIAAIIMNKYSKNPSDKNSCLLVGPTGSGKTLIAETVSEYFNMPMEIIDTTQLTMPGYVGANIEDFLARLISKANGDITAAENGIVVFDELDKKGSEKNEDVSGKGVLNTLLPFLQGTTYDVKYNSKTVHFNTKNLTIFATGAFTDVALGKSNGGHSKPYSKTKIGFGVNFEDKEQHDIEYEKLEIEDFVKFGNIPIEIMGRFPVIVQLDGHTIESLKRILIESTISPLLAEQEKLNNFGIKLNYTDDYLTAVANAAFKLKTGARSLKNIVEKTVKSARWEALEKMPEYNEIILIGSTVDDNLDCILVKSDGTRVNLKDLKNQKIKIKK